MKLLRSISDPEIHDSGCTPLWPGCVFRHSPHTLHTVQASAYHCESVQKAQAEGELTHRQLRLIPTPCSLVQMRQNMQSLLHTRLNSDGFSQRRSGVLL